MSLDQNLRRISPATLKLWIDSLEPSTLAIVDVRDGDHVGGHIRHSINVPSSRFVGSLNSLQSKISHADRVVVYCQLSQQRGPSCASLYARHVASKGGRSQEIVVLDGGFSGWAQVYGPDERYTEAFAPDLYR